MYWHYCLSALGEEKPQPFITLDIDRQVDGKLVVSNHVPLSPPNGRLPISAAYPQNKLTPLPTQIPPSQPTALGPSPPLHALDGGVYQGGHPPPAPTQPTTKVDRFACENSFLKICLDERTNH